MQEDRPLAEETGKLCMSVFTTNLARSAHQLERGDELTNGGFPEARKSDSTLVLEVSGGL
jgi:hypothetical protein